MISIEQIKYLKPYLIEKRRYLHAHPEVGFEVQKTHDYVKNELELMGIKVIPHVGVNSLLGVIENGEGPILGLRADMDALPMQEMNTDIDYNSQNPGCMHACGHDAHTSMLLTAASYLQSHLEDWNGTIYFIFQEAEEGPNPGGAYGIVKSGLLDSVEHFYAFHVSSAIDSGVVAVKRNEAMASADTLKITLKGKGAHAAYPHLSIDPIIMATEVVQGIQTILSRRKNPLDPAVITIAQIHGGTAHNIIPETCYLEGTVRTFSFELREWIKKEITALLDSVTSRVGGSFEFDYIYEYDPTINTSSEVDLIKKVVLDTLSSNQFVELTTPTMGAEDFSKYISLRQGAMAWLGTKKDEATSYSMHHPHFNLDEEALIIGSMTFVNLVMSYKKG